MLAVGTTIYSPIFIALAISGFLLLSVPLYSMWFKYIFREKIALYATVVRLVLTLIVLTFYMGLVTLAWNVKQDVTTNTSDYVSPAEKEEQKRVSETKSTTKDEINQKREEQKKVENQSHEKSLDSFDEAMKKEAEKIKERSLTQPS